MTPVPSSPVALLDQLDELRANATPGPWAQSNADPAYVIAPRGDEDYEDVADAGARCSPGRPGWEEAESDAALIVAAVNAVGPLADAVRAALDEHRPMANRPGRQPACPDCLGGIHAADPDAARSCGCWGLSTPVCSSCADKDGPRLHPVQWPCPTVAAVTAALSVTP